jgi:hypothetical protein
MTRAVGATLVMLLGSLVCAASMPAQTSLSSPAASVLFDTGHRDHPFMMSRPMGDGTTGQSLADLGGKGLKY